MGCEDDEDKGKEGDGEMSGVFFGWGGGSALIGRFGGVRGRGDGEERGKGGWCTICHEMMAVATACVLCVCCADEHACVL